MTQESRLALLGLWSVVKTIIICAGLAHLTGGRWSEIMAAVAAWKIWADRIMREEAKAAKKGD